MAAEAKDKKSSRAQVFLGLLVGVLVLLFSLTQVYERAELVTYDWRFNIRNGLFGVLPTDPRLGTVDVDNPSVTAEGRYQDWTRDKYTEVVRILDEYGARMLGFDVYFIEPSTKVVTEEQVRQLKGTDPQSLDELFARVDYDGMFRQAIEAAGNVYLAQTVVVPQGEEVARKVEPRTPDKEAALAVIRQHAPRLMVDPARSTLWRGLDFTPPLRLLREAARGFAYAQTVPDVDGARRRYPLIYQYEDVVLPSIALLMVCDFLQVPITAVEVWPGDHVRLPGAHLSAGPVADLDIPIDQYGNMYVNWAGRWHETFVHYPHIGLRWAAGREQRQRALEKVKELVAADPGLRGSLQALAGGLAGAGFADPQLGRAAVLTWMQAGGIEQTVRQNPQLEAAQFWRSKGVEKPAPLQLELFAQVQRNNRIAELLTARPESTPEELRAALPGQDPEAVRQSEEFVRGLMVGGQVPAAARPLYFFPYVVFEGRPLTPADLKDKILFYGYTATGSTDLSVIPFEGSYPMVGIYPNVLNTILQEKFIRRMAWWAGGLLVLAIGILLSVVVPRLKVLQGAILIGGLLLVYLLLAFSAFTYAGYWLDITGPVLALVVGYLALTIYGYVLKEKEKEFVQGAFGHYLSPAVVDYIIANPQMVDQLGGEERVMTAFFSDIASFSTISECLTPAELVRFINQYLSEMCDIIESYGGTIDKFEGDAIVAFFGAPMFYEDHAVRGCMATIDQQHKLVELRQRWQADKSLPEPLQRLRERWEGQGRTFAQVRMGLTCGPMIVGNMGSHTRTDYTMMGDTVNLAARFESGQKIYGTNIMVNDALMVQVKDMVESRRLDLIQVVGKEEPVACYEILGRKGELRPEKYQVLDLYQQGLERYLAFDFAGARELFEQSLRVDPRDGPSALYADRCEEFVASPPKDLVYRPQSK